MNAATDRVWVVTPPSPRMSPPLAIFDAHDREELCQGYEEQGWTVRGPYTLHICDAAPPPGGEAAVAARQIPGDGSRSQAQSNDGRNHMTDDHISLSYDRVSRIIARDPDTEMIYLGGLGGLGVGRMWTAEMEWHRDDPAYASAEIRSCPEEDKQRWG